METFGERLRRLRKEKGWNVSQAAKHARISQQVLDRLERKATIGNVQVWTLKRLADVYNVRMEYLCEGFEDPRMEPVLAGQA